MKKVAVLQSNYIPWKGYFDIIHEVDEFIFYDEVQFTKNDWRNRNRISTPSGIVTVSRLPQSMKVASPILFRLFGSVTRVRFPQSAKAP